MNQKKSSKKNIFVEISLLVKINLVFLKHSEKEATCNKSGKKLKNRKIGKKIIFLSRALLHLPQEATPTAGIRSTFCEIKTESNKIVTSNAMKKCKLLRSLTSRYFLKNYKL